MLTWGMYTPCMGHNYFTLLHLINSETWTARLLLLFANCDILIITI